MLLERVLRVGAEAVLGVVAGLLGALLGSGALLVDVVGSLTGLSTRLALGVGRLTAGVGSRHFGVCWLEIKLSSVSTGEHEQRLCEEMV